MSVPQPIPAGIALPEFVALLPEQEVPRGNVRLRCTGTRKKITSEPVTVTQADAIPRGRREQRPGLVYDDSKPGCDFTEWRLDIEEHNERRLLLEGIDGGQNEIVDVGRLPNDPANDDLLAIGEHWHEVHGAVRGREPAVGGMKGAGSHIAPDGFLRAYACDPRERRDVASGMERAGRAFEAHFDRRGVGWREMLSLQAELWPKGTPPPPLSPAQTRAPSCTDASTKGDCGDSSSMTATLPRSAVEHAAELGRERQ